MNDAFSIISHFAVGAVVKGSIATAAALFLTRALRIGSANTRFAVLLSALVGGAALGGLTNIVPAFAESASVETAALGPSWFSIPSVSVLDARDPVSSDDGAEIDAAGSRAVPSRTRFAALPLIRAGITAAWAAGALGLFLYWALGGIALRGLLKRATVGRQGKALDCFRRLRRIIGVGGRERLLLCDAPIPFASGILRPVVCIPRASVDWDEAKLEATLLHELAHLKRRDLLSMALARAALAVTWASPLSWMAYAALKRDREEAADGMVLNGGVRPSSYASVLLGFYAAAGSNPGSANRACGIVRGGGESAARRRISRVLSGRPGAGRGYAIRRVLAIAGVCAAAFALAPVRMAYAQTTDASAFREIDDGSDIAIQSIETSGDDATLTLIAGKAKSTIKGSAAEFPLLKPLAEGLCVPARVSLAFGDTTNPISGRPYRHNGIDVRAMPGTAVVASGDGAVKEARFDEGLGNYVVIEHGRFYSVYAHLQAIEVKAGQDVKAGERIGLTGSTGISTGPHLHFEIRVKDERWEEGILMDPAAFIFRKK